MKIYILSILLCSATAISYEHLIRGEWEVFKLEHGKSYTTSEEEQYRFEAFLENKHKIAVHNARYEKGEVTFKQGLNEYSDMPHHEFVRTMNGFRPVNETLIEKTIQPKRVHFRSKDEKVADAIDWRTRGAVTPVKNQGRCGSCYAFSSTGALEGRKFVATKKLESMSEQNLIDCTRRYGNLGCSGGFMEANFQYVEDNKGIDSEVSYPYEARVDSCRYNAQKSDTADSGFVRIKRFDEGDLLSAVNEGPVAVAIDASHSGFANYRSGIYYEPYCSQTHTNHAVLVVGYGVEEGQDYWLVKNSWGTSFGDEGYIKMSRNRGNNCGIASFASYPIFE